jgi:protein associated with RNAse G/E
MMRIMRDIQVVFTKYDDSLHWHMTMQWLGEDEFGVWAGMVSGRSMAKGGEEPVVLPSAHVSLFPRSGWWTAWFNDASHDVSVYCDVITPATWTSPDVVTMVDLDLDVIRHRRDDSVQIVDEDEFALHRVRYGYPHDVVERARATADWLRSAVSAGTEPFGTAFRSWLSRVEG